MLKFKESYKHLSLQPTNVMNHNFSSSPNSILIDVGKNKINKNQAVIDMNGLHIGLGIRFMGFQDIKPPDYGPNNMNY